MREETASEGVGQIAIFPGSENNHYCRLRARIIGGSDRISCHISSWFRPDLLLGNRSIDHRSIKVIQIFRVEKLQMPGDRDITIEEYQSIGGVIAPAVIFFKPLIRQLSYSLGLSTIIPPISIAGKEIPGDLPAYNTV